MAIQPTQPQGIGGVLDTAFQLYKATLGAVWPISLLLAVVGMPPTLYVLFSGAPLPDLDSDEFDLLTALGSNDPISSAIGLVCGILTMWVLGALYLKQRAGGVDEELSMGDALKAAGAKLAPVLGSTVLFVIALVVGLILLVIPGLILMVSLMLYMQLVLFDDKGPVEALTSSHKLIWGNWWRSTAILSVAFILVLVIFMAVGVVSAVAAPFLGIAIEDFVVIALVGELVFNALFNLLFMPFLSAVMIALYWDLKLRKEGGDLAARVNALHAT